MIQNLGDFIRVYEDQVPPEFCQDLIDRFENCPEQHQSYKQTAFQFTQFIVSQFWPEAHQRLLQIFEQRAISYCTHVGVQRQFWPEKIFLEGFRIKRYLPGTGDAFHEHVDVTDYPTARRFLAMFVYLNDVTEGGETSFFNDNLSIKPVTGRMVCFPPTWQWPHRGKPPVSGPKYLLNTYLNFV